MALTHEEIIKRAKILDTQNRNCSTSVEQKENICNCKEDNINHPKHYTSNVPIIKVECDCGRILEVPIECIDIIRNMPSWKGNAIKYLWREGLKGDSSLNIIDKEIEDLKKAIWYIEDKIKQLEYDKTRI